MYFIQFGLFGVEVIKILLNIYIHNRKRFQVVMVITTGVLDYTKIAKVRRLPYLAISNFKYSFTRV